MKKERAIKTSLSIFWIISLLNVLSGLLEWSSVEAVSKTFIIPTLAVYLALKLPIERHSIRKWLLGALFFSWLGDVLLLGSGSSSSIPFFLLGLAAFLVAHLIYLFSFLKIRTLIDGDSNPNYLIVAPLLLYLVVLLYVLWEGLTAEMKIPVLLYGLGISSMAVVGFQLKSTLKPSHFAGFYSGILLFLLSDSIIGINRFAFEIPFSGFLIMSTYIAAQFLIIHYLSKFLNQDVAI